MDLNAYAGRLTRDLYAVGRTGDEELAEVTERLAGILESSVRVVLLDAVVEATAEISQEFAPGSVEVRLRGRDVGFAVTPAGDRSGPQPALPPPSAGAGATTDLAGAGTGAGTRDVTGDVKGDVTGADASGTSAKPPAPSEEDDADGGTARLSLRLPERLKPKVEQAAAAAGLSVNAWLVRSISTLVETPAQAPAEPPPRATTPLTGQRHVGWVR